MLSADGGGKQFSGSEADDNFYLDCAADNDGSWTAVEIFLIVNVNISSAIIYKDFSVDWNVASPTNHHDPCSGLQSRKYPPVRQLPLCRHKVCRQQFCPPECAWKQDSIVSLHMFDYQPDAELVSLQPLPMAKVGCVVAKQAIRRKRGGARGTQAPGIESISSHASF